MAYRTILVPLDGSAFSEHALPVAADIARHCGARVRLVRVHVPPPADGFEIPIVASMDPEVRAADEEYLRLTAERLRAKTGVETETALLECPVVGAIENDVRARPADLVVMTTHGRGAFSKFWLGSVAEVLMRHLTVPVIAVRPQGDPPPLGSAAAPRHVMVCMDGSRASEGILAPVAALAEIVKARLTLFRAVADLPALRMEPGSLSTVGINPDILERLRGQARDDLARLAGPLRDRGLTVSIKVVIHDHPPTAIVEAVAEDRCDLIALETHGRGGLGRLVLGSVVDKVIRTAPVPVFVHRTAASSAI
jgi:nucleotide-binding universal stress UspA family protein